MYTIGEVAKMYGLPVSTLRYYDNQGLFPKMKRVSGIRQFGDEEVEALRIIECLKKSGLEIKDIKQFMDWCVEGPSTYRERKELLERQRDKVIADIAHMQDVLDLLNYKCDFYNKKLNNENKPGK